MAIDMNDSELGERRAREITSGMVDSKTGDVLGGLVKLPVPMRLLYDSVSPKITAFLSKASGESVARWTEKGLEAMGVEGAENTGRITGKFVAMTLPYLDSVGHLNKTRKIYADERKYVLGKFAPLLAANIEAEKKGVTGNIKALFHTGYEGNLLIEDALKVAKDNLYRDLAMDATRIIPIAAINGGTLVDAKLNSPAIAEDAKALAKWAKVKEGINWGESASGIVQTSLLQAAAPPDLGETLAKRAYGKVEDVVNYLHDNELDGTIPTGSAAHVQQTTTLITEAFQQFQKDHGRRALPSSRLHDVSATIAEAMVLGDMNALSLVDLIGRDEVLNTKHNGFKSDTEIKKILTAETTRLSRHATIDVEAFLSAANYTLDDVKAHLQTKDKDERAIVAFLHDDPVLIKAGMKKEEIQDLRKHFPKQVILKAMEGAVVNLAAMNDEQLSSHGFDNEGIYALRSFAENPALISQAIGNPIHSEQLKGLVRREVMSQDPDYIQKLIHQKMSYGGSAEMPFAAQEDMRRAADQENGFSLGT